MLQLPLGKAVFTPRPDYYKGMLCNPLDIVAHADAVWCCLEQTSAAPAEGSPAWMLMLSGTGANKYDLCDTFYDSISLAPKPGMYPAMGGLITNASDMVPDAWDYLQTAEGQTLCKTEAEWQGMTKTTWNTLADGTKVGWEGIGGAPFYVLDLGQNTLRVPDVRGMYAESAGFDGLQVAGVHGDGMRRMQGYPNNSFLCASLIVDTPPTDRGVGVLRNTHTSSHTTLNGTGSGYVWSNLSFDSAYHVPTSKKIQPRAYGTNRCVYLGLPK